MDEGVARPLSGGAQRVVQVLDLLGPNEDVRIDREEEHFGLHARDGFLERCMALR
jgi:hypothetical protein